MMKSMVAGAAALTMSLGLFAEAAMIEVDGTQYEVTTVTGTAADLESTLRAQPFFGSVGDAIDFATALGPQLGTPNDDLGPLFVFDLRVGNDPLIASRAFSEGPFGGIIGFQSEATNGTFTFALAEPQPVPLPAALPLFAAGLAALRFGVKRKNA
jgi:hypothetical protein